MLEPSAASGDLLPIPAVSISEQRERPQSLGVFLVVEVPGIEPGSNGTNRSILRAQSLCGAFSLAGLCDPSANTAYITVGVPHAPVTGALSKPSR